MAEEWQDVIEDPAADQGQGDDVDLDNNNDDDDDDNIPVLQDDAIEDAPAANNELKLGNVVVSQNLYMIFGDGLEEALKLLHIPSILLSTLVVNSILLFTDERKKNELRKTDVMKDINQIYKDDEIIFCSAKSSSADSVVDVITQDAVMKKRGPLKNLIERHASKKLLPGTTITRLQKSQARLDKIRNEHPDVYQEVQELLKRRGNGGEELDDEHDNHEVTFVEDENNTKMGWGKKLFSVAFIIGIITLLYASVLVLCQEGTSSCGAAVKTFASSAKKVSGDIFSFSRTTASNVFDNWPLCLEDSSSDVDLLATDDICKTNNCLITIPSPSSINKSTHELSSNVGGIISKVFAIMKPLFDGSIGSIMSNFFAGDGSVSSHPSSIINHTQPTPPMCFPPDNFVEVVILPVLIQNQDKAEIVIESLECKVHEMKELESSLMGKVNGLEQSEAVLKDQLNEVEKKLSNTEDENEQLKGNLFGAQKEAEQQQLVNQRLEAEKDKLEETIQGLQDTVTKYKAEVSQYHASLTSLGNDKKDIEAEKNKLEDIATTLEAKAVQYQATIVSLENDNQRLEAEVVQYQTKITSLRGDKRNLEAQVKEHQETIESLLEVDNAKSVQYQATIKSLEYDNQDLRAQVAQYQALLWALGIPVLSLVVGFYYIRGNLLSGRFVSCI